MERGGQRDVPGTVDDTLRRRAAHLQLVRLYLSRTEVDQITSATITVQPRNVQTEQERILKSITPLRL